MELVKSFWVEEDIIEIGVKIKEMFKPRLEYLLMLGAPNSGKDHHHGESAGKSNSEPNGTDEHTKEYCVENHEILDKVN